MSPGAFGPSSFISLRPSVRFALTSRHSTVCFQRRYWRKGARRFAQRNKGGGGTSRRGTFAEQSAVHPCAPRGFCPKRDETKQEE